MSNKTIAELPEKTASISGDDYVLIWDSSAKKNNSKKIKASNLNTYSETEFVIGTWYDGKPIYRKVVTGVSFGNVDWAGGVMQASLSGDYSWIKELLSAKTYVDSTWHTCVKYNANSYRLWLAQDCYSYSPVTKFIIEYTKTEDY